MYVHNSERVRFLKVSFSNRTCKCNRVMQLHVQLKICPNRKLVGDIIPKMISKMMSKVIWKASANAI